MDKELSLLSGWTQISKKREKLAERARELINSREEGKTCSFPKDPVVQEVFLCRTCNTCPEGSGVCLGCYLQCHLDHEVVELGPKTNLVCDCGNSRMSNKCTLNSQKPLENPDNSYSHNFKGKFCICDSEDSEETRESEMFMCVGCQDWFHSTCVQSANNSHNLADKEFHQTTIPQVPLENLEEFFFVCEKCLQNWLYIPSAYKEYIYTEETSKRNRVDECPVKTSEFPKFPYHVFVKLTWLDERCKCSSCEELFPKEFQIIQKLDNRTLLEELEAEAEKIFEEEQEEEDPEEEEVFSELSNMPHETQLEIAQGYNLLRESLSEFVLDLQGSVCNLQQVEDFKKKLQEKYEAYKKSKY